jgi:hypothetical protein
MRNAMDTIGTMQEHTGSIKTQDKTQTQCGSTRAQSKTQNKTQRQAKVKLVRVRIIA